MLAQFGGDVVSTIVWIILFIIMIIFGPRLMTTQTILKLEKEATDLEEIAEKSKNYIIRALSKRPNAKLRENVSNFLEFFAIAPVSIDPYGVIKKIDHVIKNSDQRFRYFVNQVAPDFSEAKKRDIKNALEGAMMTHQIAKIVRHYLELIKKFKLFQLAMIIQMQIPLISREAKAAMHATHAFVDGLPIGDGIGPYVAASLINEKPLLFKEEEFVVAKTNILGRTVFVAKADGPGASTGFPGKFLLKFIKKQKINKIITIDAALKLEGEKTGSVAEGVGVAMGGSGVDRYEIEEIAVKNNIPLDAVAIKLSEEDALEPMKKEVLDSVPKAVEAVKKAVLRSGRNEKILILGIGNTCGIGNDASSLSKTQEKLKNHFKAKEKKK
ncbi:MAG: DUF1512 family protein [Candidatus Aenigmatarchaeota archaeon]